MQNTVDESKGLTLQKFTGFLTEIQNQPAWRSTANKEMQYAAGNQYDSQRLTELEKRGILPAIENCIKGGIESMLGAEVKSRTDFRVIPDSNTHDKDQDTADALNYKLNQSERRSRADRCVSDAYESQISVGLGWVEVAREENKFKYPYNCKAISRNEIYWDWFAQDPMLDDARYLIRKKWGKKDEVISQFPEHADIINASFSSWQGTSLNFMDGSTSVDLARSLETMLTWDVDKELWLDIERQRVMIYEVWYRKWEKVECIKLQDGRVAELDRKNPYHIDAINNGLKVMESVAARLFVSIWIGCHKVSDDETPYAHNHFPYVPFWGYREDLSRVPYGKIRAAMYLQDEINIHKSKILWLMSSYRVERTSGVVKLTDEQFRVEVARPDADILLDADELAKSGSRFEVKTDFQLLQHHIQSLQESKASLNRVLGVGNEYQGVQSNASSNSQEVTRIQQSTQALANLDDNKNEARIRVGELLLSMLIQDSWNEEQVTIKGGLIREDRTVILNQKVIDYDGDIGIEYLTNNVENTMLKVTLSEVPSTQSYKQQQYSAISEAYKSSPPEYQRILMPHLVSLMDLGENKEDIIKAIREADKQPNPEMEKLKAEMEFKNKELELKSRELAIKERLAESKISMDVAAIEKLISEKVKILGEAQFSAIQTAMQLTPLNAPIADQIMDNSGYVPQAPKGNYPMVDVSGLQQGQQPIPIPVHENTSPGQPPIPQQAEPVQPAPETPQEQMMPSDMQGIETLNPTD
jgi:hypothetical protein